MSSSTNVPDAKGSGLFSGGGQEESKVEKVENVTVQKLADDGVVNPQGLYIAGAGAVFLAAIPITSWIATPNSILEKTVNGLCSSLAFISTAGSSSKIAQTSKIAALGAIYCTVTYAFAGAGSAAAIAAGSKGGRDNDHPRSQIAALKGLPLRLNSARDHLVENFPGFAFAAVLAQVMAPGDQTLVNLLGLHVLAKCFVFYPAYIWNLGTARSLAHVVATTSVLNVAFKLAKRA